jgi:glucokinase
VTDPTILGLDVGGTKLASGVFREGALEAFRVTPAEAHEGPDRMIARLIALGTESLAESGLRPTDVSAIGVACGGPLDPERGIVFSPPNLPGWDGVPLAARLSAAFEVPVVIENDASAAALGEWQFGAGRGVDDLVYLTVSTGIGGGVVSGGRLLRGATGNAAELGHITAVPGGRPCGCLRRLGCVEAYASGTSIADRAIDAGMSPSTTAREVVAAVQSGDAIATQVWADTTAILGAAIASLVNAFDPALVVLGGGVTRAGDMLFDPIREIVRREAFEPMASNVAIAPAGLGAEVGVWGGVAIALERAVAPEEIAEPQRV